MERRSFEQIDLTGQIPMWRMVDDRNREICSAAPLVYYNVVRPPPAQTGSGERPSEGVSETGGSAPRSIEAMGSNANQMPDVDVPGENVEGKTPQSPPPETSLAQSPKSPMDFEELKQGNTTYTERYQKAVSLFGGEDQLPAELNETETLDEYLRRLDQWLSEQVTEEKKQEAKWLYEVYMKLAQRKQDKREGDLARALKEERLKEKPDLTAEMKTFDLIQSFITQGKETAEFHKQVSEFLVGLQGCLDAPLEKFPQIVPELSNMIQEIGKLMTASDTVQSRNLQTVEGLRGVLEAVKWELSGKSIDKRAIPQWDKSNTSRIMNESTREVMAGIRWGIEEMGHVLREQGLLQEKQSKALESLASSSQRTAELLEMINARESKNQDAMEKQKADKLLAEQKRMDAVRLKAQKDQAEKDRVAQEEADRKRALQAELDNANAGIEAAQKRAKMAKEAMGQTPTTPVHPPVMPTMPVPEPLYPPGFLPPQMQMVPPAGWTPMTPGSQMGYGVPTGPMMAPPGPVTGPMPTAPAGVLPTAPAPGMPTAPAYGMPTMTPGNP